MVDGMIGYAGEHFAQIGFGIEVIEFRRTNQAVERSGTFSTLVGSGKQVVLPIMYTCT